MGHVAGYCSFTNRVCHLWHRHNSLFCRTVLHVRPTPGVLDTYFCSQCRGRVPYTCPTRHAVPGNRSPSGSDAHCCYLSVQAFCQAQLTLLHFFGYFNSAPCMLGSVHSGPVQHSGCGAASLGTHVLKCSSFEFRHAQNKVIGWGVFSMYAKVGVPP